jgi:hypothetical protein
MPDGAGAILGRYYREVWVQRNVDALDGLLAPGYVDHDPPPGSGPDRASARALAAAFTAGMRDAELTILGLVADDTHAAAHWRLEWTQAGPFLGDPAADGARLALRGSDLVRVEDGRIAEIHHVENVLAVVRQLAGR